MFYKKQGFPEVDDIMICTIKKILPNCVFVILDEYENKEGLIHISEISPGRIRNIRDFVKEGKKIVCKILRIDKIKNHIDLSLRRVNQAQRINKNSEYKQEQKSEKILELVAKEVKRDLLFMYKEAGNKIIEDYGSLTSCFQDVVKNGESVLNNLKIAPNITKSLTELINKRIKIKEVEIDSTLLLSSNKSNGIEIIKETLKKLHDLAVKNQYKLKIQYTGAPKYRMILTAQDYKTAERQINELAQLAIKNIQGSGEGKFIRNDKRDT